MKQPTRPPSSTRLVVLAALCAMGLTACGGGGDAAGAAVDVGSTTDVPTAPPVITPVAGATCGIPDFAAVALARINQARAAGANCGTAGSFAPASALTWSSLLTQAAQTHSQDMVAHNFFSHTGSNGSSLSGRVNATGYAWSTLGENIAAGYSGIEQVMAGWLASDGHCANLMNPAFNQVGMVCVPGNAASSYSSYWTMGLARSR